MLIIGAKGFAKELLETLTDNGLEQFTFFDDVSTEQTGCIFENYPVITSSSAAADYVKNTDNRFVLAVGNPGLRKKLAEKFEALGGVLTGITSTRASVGRYNTLLPGTTILQQAVVENDNHIGRGCLVHTGAFISHDVHIGDFCEISPYAKLLGGAQAGHGVSLGTGAIILPGIQVGSHAVIGAGCVVTKPVPDYTVLAGVPGRPIGHALNKKR